MKEPFVWTVDYYGSLHKLYLNQLRFECIFPYDPATRKNTFKRVSASASCVWGIGGDQNVYMMVYKTDLPILTQEHCYENERWYIRHGFSEKSLFSTDRFNWSSKDGKTELKRDLFYLPNDCWSWQDDWFIDKSIDCDIEGWEYALDFPRQYFNQQHKTSFVRRRRWARQRKFTGFDTWILMPTVLSDDPFYDIAIGGDQIQGQTQGFLAVWAITFTGKIFFRGGVDRLCLEGKEWIEIKSDEFNLVHISVGPSGVFGGVTWDGDVVLRLGTDHCNPSGTRWQVIRAPSSHLFSQVSVGRNALWAITKQRKVFFHRGMNRSLEDSQEKDWVEMVGSFDLISVGPNDQVITLSTVEGCLCVRTGVTNLEPVGRQWKKLDISANVDISAMCCCIDNGSCDIDNKFVEQLGRCQKSFMELSISKIANTTWRKMILDYVCERNSITQEFMDKTIQIFDNESDWKKHKWNKRCSCKCLVDQHYDHWVDSHLKLVCSDADDGTDSSQAVLFVYYNLNSSFKEWSVKLADIVCLHRLKHATRPYSFTILAYDEKKEALEQEVILQMENEKILLEWMESLTKEKQTVVKPSMEIYATSLLGDIYKCSVMDSKDFSQNRWTKIAGHLKQVVRWTDGIVWGFGFDGVPFVLSEKVSVMECDEEHIIYENERWNPVEGFTQRLLPSDRCAWSDVTGRINSAKDQYILPSCNYRWIGEWNISYNLKKFDADGWQYAFDFPRQYHNYRGYNDYVRRRIWKRKCHLNSTGPWERLNTDVKIVELSISEESNACSVWAVACNGSVLYRTNVNKENVKGDDWILVATETPVTSISIGTKSRVWCVAADGSCYMRAGFQDDKHIGSNWLHIPRETQNICQISVGKSVIMALDNEGCAYLRQNVTNIYPEGTSWSDVIWEHVTNISVNKEDQVSFVQNGDVMLCTEVINEPNKLIAILKDGWQSVCYRCILPQPPSPSNDEHQKDKPSSSLPIPISSQSSLIEDDGTFNTTPVDPYSVDIYSFYGKS